MITYTIDTEENLYFFCKKIHKGKSFMMKVVKLYFIYN